MNKGNFEFTCPNTAKVFLQWEKFNGKSSAPKNEAVLFLPGVALDTESFTVRQTALEFAKTLELNTYVAYTRVEDLSIRNTQYYQAMAIAKLITELGIDSLTIVGNSQGAKRALHLNHLLKSNKSISVSGLVLTNPAGLYNQDPLKLIFRFFVDGLILAPIVLTIGQMGKKIKIRTKEIWRAFQLLWDVTSGLLIELRRSGKKIASRMKREADEASKEFEYFGETEVPMVVIFGEKDLPFSPSRFERALKLTSGFRRILVGRRISTHGLHYFRIEQVAKISWYLLNKTREKTVINSNPKKHYAQVTEFFYFIQQ